MSTQTPNCSENKALFVGGLLDSTTSEAIHNYFSSYGEIEDVNLIIDWVTGRSKRCAIIICKEKSTAETIIAHKTHKIEGRKVRVDIADQNKKGTKIVKTKKLFLGHINQAISESELLNFFTEYGEVKHVKILKSTIMYPPGDMGPSFNGYLEYKLPEDAQKLLQDRHNLIIKGFKIFCQPFKANNAQEGLILKEISDMNPEMLEACLTLFLQMQQLGQFSKADSKYFLYTIKQMQFNTMHYGNMNGVSQPGPWQGNPFYGGQHQGFQNNSPYGPNNNGNSQSWMTPSGGEYGSMMNQESRGYQQHHQQQQQNSHYVNYNGIGGQQQARGMTHFPSQQQERSFGNGFGERREHQPNMGYVTGNNGYQRGVVEGFEHLDNGRAHLNNNYYQSSGHYQPGSPQKQQEPSQWRGPHSYAQNPWNGYQPQTQQNSNQQHSFYPPYNNSSGYHAENGYATHPEKYGNQQGINGVIDPNQRVWSHNHNNNNAWQQQHSQSRISHNNNEIIFGRNDRNNTTEHNNRNTMYTGRNMIPQGMEQTQEQSSGHQIDQFYRRNSSGLYEESTNSLKSVTKSGDHSNGITTNDQKEKKNLHKLESNEVVKNVSIDDQDDSSSLSQNSLKKSRAGSSNDNTRVETQTGSPETKHRRKNTTNGSISSERERSYPWPITSKILKTQEDFLPKRHMSLRLIPDDEQEDIAGYKAKPCQDLNRNEAILGLETMKTKKKSEDDIYEEELLKSTNIVFKLFD